MRDYTKIVEHHIKYVETHGYDETVFITDKEHQNINHRELFPFISSEELAKISRAAYRRTQKFKDRKAERIRFEISMIPTDEQMREAVRTKAIL